MIGQGLLTFKRALPGGGVLITVLVLLRGFRGTADALKLQLSTFAGSFFGSSGELARVLLHTMPLAAAAAVAAFAIANRWIKFEGPGSIVGLASIVMAGAATGGFLQGWGRPLRSQRLPLSGSICSMRENPDQPESHLCIGRLINPVSAMHQNGPLEQLPCSAWAKSSGSPSQIWRMLHPRRSPPWLCFPRSTASWGFH